jgi:hypothetical protein
MFIPKSGDYSFSSEMWSFGILMWEMWSYGRVPYRKIFVEKVLEEIEKGTRCEIIENVEKQNKMPDAVRSLLNYNSLWSIHPKSRPPIEIVSKIINDCHQ